MQSRYYDPVTHRFINADSLASTGQGILGYNMFVYCLNNPVIYGDTEGTDAALMINIDAVSGNGHVCFVVQDGDGEWHYFSFATGRSNIYTGLACLFGGYVKGVIYSQDLGTSEGYDLSTLAGFKDFLTEKGDKASNAAEVVDYVIYIEGDFTKSFQRASSLSERQGKWWGKLFPTQYNLLDYNCMHFALDMLSESKDAFTDEQFALLEKLLQWYIVPSNNIDKMQSLGVTLQ